jgi:hypothetical protein
VLPYREANSKDLVYWWLVVNSYLVQSLQNGTLDFSEALWINVFSPAEAQ